MNRFSKRICLVILLCLSAIAIAAEKNLKGSAEYKPKLQIEKHPTALELLDKYTQALDSTESFIAYYESVDKFSYHVLGYTPRLIGAKMFRRGQNRSDGRRKYFREYQWGDFNAQLRNLPKDAPHYNCRVTNDKKSYAHARLVNDHRSKGSVSCWEGTKKEAFSKNTTNSHILGFMGSDERLDAVLRGADRISVRPTTETISGSDCYVIDAHTKYVKYSVWLDPEHGYHPIRVRRRAIEGDEHFNKGVLSKGHIRTAYLDNVRFEKIDGVWIPMEADRGYDDIYGVPGSFSKGVTHFKRTKIVLNPDHDKLGSFDNPLENSDQDPELVNGTKVRIVGDKARYTWQDGKLIPDKDRAKPKPTKKPPRPSR